MPRLPDSVRVKLSYGTDQEWIVTGVGECRYCRAPIYWCQTHGGKANPVDMEDDEEGLRLSHFATCSEVALVRRDHPVVPCGRDRAAGES